MCRRVISARAAIAVAASLFATGTIAETPAAPFTTEVAPGVHVHVGKIEVFGASNGGDAANCSFVVGADAVAVIDTCGSARLGARLREAIRGVTDKPIRYVINTHMHFDHLFGNAAFVIDKPEFVAHAKLARGLAARSERYLEVARDTLSDADREGIAVVPPTRPVEGKLTLDLGGGRTLILDAEPTAHTDNDLVIEDTATGTLFLGDLLFAEHTPVIDGSILGWLRVLDTLAARPAQRVVPGHGPASMPWPQALEPQRRYLDTIAREAREAIRAGRTLTQAIETVGRSEAGNWKLFDEFHARNVTTAFAELEWE